MENDKHVNSKFSSTTYCVTQALLICVCLCKAGWGGTEVND